MDALYIPYTLCDPSSYPDGKIEDDGRVELVWYCVARPQPIAPYDALICAYATLEEPYKAQAQHYLDELFTRDEATLLLPHLCFAYGLAGVSTMPMPMDIWVRDGESMAHPVAPLVEGGELVLAETLPSRIHGPQLLLSVNAYYIRRVQ